MSRSAAQGQRVIVKVGLAAVVVAMAAMSARTVDLRQLYNEMYPVSTLKRDALSLCHESDPTFVRAVEEDRAACYNGMPHAIASSTVALPVPTTARRAAFWQLAKLH